jgi:ABC-type dipeptide/oligopeptide/nickel transport system ATPase subunit
VPRILWLSGMAGKGKSAIAHTIANWSHERGGMRACFCFDRTREASKATTAPVQIVIDALDESGDANTREQILCLLS